MAKSATTKKSKAVKALGKNWGKIFQTAMMSQAVKAATKKAAESSTGDTVEVRVQTIFYVTFPRKSKLRAEDGGVRCACTSPQEGVCVCIGACSAADDCLPIVV